MQQEPGPLSLPPRTKVATAAFVFGKLNSVMAAVTMFVSIKLAIVFTAMAVLGVGTAMVLCALQLSATKRLEALGRKVTLADVLADYERFLSGDLSADRVKAIASAIRNQK